MTIRNVLTAVAIVCFAIGNLQAQAPISLSTDRDEIHTSAIENALESRISVSYANVALSDLVDEWREKFQVNFHIDRVAMEEYGLNAEELTFTAKMKDVRFASLLSLLLDEVDLSFSPRADHILITTPDKMETDQQLVRVYPVQDLVLVARAGRIEQDFDSLSDTLMAATAPDTWDVVGGYGSIEPVPASGVLVINQTWHVHQQVAALLAATRDSRDTQGIPVLPASLQPAETPPAKGGGFIGGSMVPVVGQGGVSGLR